jgi:hypothetical protein
MISNSGNAVVQAGAGATLTSYGNNQVSNSGAAVGTVTTTPLL